MKIGIYGGSFDPPHWGHKEISKYVIKKLNLDKLIIVPIGIASHGKNNLTSSKYRLKMCELTFLKIPKTVVSSIEIDKNKTSYTYETLMNLIKEFGKNNEYFEIIGEDSANYFDKWKEYKKILEYSTVVVLKRKGFKNKIISNKMIEIDNPYFDISSTEIRNNIKCNIDISNYLDLDTVKFINSKNLYKK